MKRLTEFETAVLSKLLAGEHAALAILRQQLAIAETAKRENTGVGFFTSLTLNRQNVPAVSPRKFQLSDVEAELEGLENGAGFILFVNDGYLDLLEGFAYDEPWPGVVNLKKLFYRTGDTRQLQVLDGAIR